jgi:hypothetical protein
MTTPTTIAEDICECGHDVAHDPSGGDVEWNEGCGDPSCATCGEKPMCYGYCPTCTAEA